MIAKRITSKARTSRIARLVKYVVAAEGSLDPRSWKRTADYVLCSKINERGEKVGGVRVTNCHTDDPAAATSLIEATQAANTRSKTDKTYHLVFSFPPGEQPDIKILHAIEDQLVAAIGYAEHQRISAVHIDTDHLHVHVAINKVHPRGFQNIEPYFDKKKLMETCERLELEYGLTRTNHGLTGERKRENEKSKQVHISNERGSHDTLRSNNTGEISNRRPGEKEETSNNIRDSSSDERPRRPKNKAADIEAHTGIETLLGYMAREVTPRLLEAKSWKELHSILAGHGLEIKKRGNGLVIGNGQSWVKASQCDRALSLKALTDRLGLFEQGQKPAKAYEPRPQHRHVSSAVLFEQYQRQRAAIQQARNYGLERIAYEGAVLNANLQRWKVAQRLLAKVAAKGPKRRAMLKMITLQTGITRRKNWEAIDAARKKLIKDTAMPSWADWLARQAEHDNTDALAILLLRGKQERESMRGNFLTVPEPARTPDISVLTEKNPRVEKKGTIIYRSPDGGVVIDRKTHVQSLRTTEGATLLALELAVQRFTGQALIVEGEDRFKNDIARLAGERGMKVRFADPSMEARRKAAIPTKPKQQSIQGEQEHE